MSTSSSSSSRPRIAPQSRSDWGPVLFGLLSLAPGGTERPMNLFTTLAKHPSLFRAWLMFAGKLLAGSLRARDREIVILRTAHRSKCDYEAAHHNELGKEAGLTDSELESLANENENENEDEHENEEHEWSLEDRALISAVDELHDKGDIDDATWSKLENRYSEQERIELVMLAGHYMMLATTVRTLRIQTDAPASSATKLTRAVQEVARARAQLRRWRRRPGL